MRRRSLRLEGGSMRRKVLGGAAIAMACAGLVIACGDDDSGVTPNPDSGPNPNPIDSSTPPSDSGGTDSGPTPDAADGSTPAVPVTPQSTTRIANANNAYGLT